MGTSAYLIFIAIMLVLFVGVVIWTFGKKRKNRYEQDGRIPFEDDEAD